MKYLIVNADDFGYSPGVNRGIAEAHEHGIVTSTSVMVDSVAAQEASQLSKYPELAVGLHYVPENTGDIDTELNRQIDAFMDIVGANPSHIDIHKVRHDDIELKNKVIEFAQTYGIPARYSGKAKFIDSFFGPHANGDVSVAQLKKSIDEATDEINELMCHVGHCDEYLRSHSSYNDLREEELKSVCNEEIKSYVSSKGLALTNWKLLAES